MSLVLAINTASKESALALIQDDRVLGETAWDSNANESTKVIPGLQTLLKEANKTWKDLTHIFVVKGPGAYTSLRVGITIANSLAWTLKIPMGATDVFTLWENRLTDSERDEPHMIAIAAGRDFYQTKNNPERYSLDQLLQHNLPMYGETPDAKPTVLSFGHAVCQLIPLVEPCDHVDPIYARPPDINRGTAT